LPAAAVVEAAVETVVEAVVEAVATVVFAAETWLPGAAVFTSKPSVAFAMLFAFALDVLGPATTPAGPVAAGCVPFAGFALAFVPLDAAKLELAVLGSVAAAAVFDPELPAFPPEPFAAVGAGAGAGWGDC